MGLISRKLCRFFFLYQSSSSSLCTVLYSISSNIDAVLLINPSVNVFIFRDFNIHHKDWLHNSGGTDQPGELCYNFQWKLPSELFQMTLLRWLTFLLGSQTVILIVLLFWIYFFLLMLVFVLQWLSLHWEILIILLSQFPLTFHQIHNRMSVSSQSFWLFSCWLGQSSWSFKRCSMVGCH